MSNKTKIIILALALLIVAAPLASFAAVADEYKPANGLVPCGTTVYPTPCSLCHLYILIKWILSFIMWYIAPVVAVLAIGIAGFKILISGANPGLRADGYKIIRTTITGLAIMFAAWVVMSEALLFFTGFSLDQQPKFLQNPWNQIICVPPKAK